MFQRLIEEAPIDPSLTDKWEVQIKGAPHSPAWEITVIRENNIHGHNSWGWIDKDKILISQSGSNDCHLIQTVWDKTVKVAHEVCDELNAKRIKKGEK